MVALRAAALEIRAGEVHALMGANGAGKSTLVKMLTGVLRPDGGVIAVKGAPVTFPLAGVEARAAGLVSVYQDPALVPDLSIAQNLRLTGASPPIGAALDGGVRVRAARSCRRRCASCRCRRCG